MKVSLLEAAKRGVAALEAHGAPDCETAKVLRAAITEAEEVKIARFVGYEYTPAVGFEPVFILPGTGWYAPVRLFTAVACKFSIPVCPTYEEWRNERRRLLAETTGVLP